jgi:hypothetical protein
MSTEEAFTPPLVLLSSLLPGLAVVPREKLDRRALTHGQWRAYGPSMNRQAVQKASAEVALDRLREDVPGRL